MELQVLCYPGMAWEISNILINRQSVQWLYGSKDIMFNGNTVQQHLINNGDTELNIVFIVI